MKEYKQGDKVRIKTTIGWSAVETVYGSFKLQLSCAAEKTRVYVVSDGRLMHNERRLYYQKFELIFAKDTTPTMLFGNVIDDAYQKDADAGTGFYIGQQQLPAVCTCHEIIFNPTCTEDGLNKVITAGPWHHTICPRYSQRYLIDPMKVGDAIDKVMKEMITFTPQQWHCVKATISGLCWGDNDPPSETATEAYKALTKEQRGEIQDYEDFIDCVVQYAGGAECANIQHIIDMLKEGLQ